MLGPKKLPEIAKSLGKALGEFQRATDGLKKEITEATDLSSSPPPEQHTDESESGKQDQPEEEADAEKKPSENAGTYKPDEIEG